MDNVGRHLYLSGQPCLNFIVIPLGKPSGGTAFEPVVMLCNETTISRFISMLKSVLVYQQDNNEFTVHGSP